MGSDVNYLQERKCEDFEGKDFSQAKCWLVQIIQKKSSRRGLRVNTSPRNLFAEPNSLLGTGAQMWQNQ
jgi:hypothetical protein